MQTVRQMTPKEVRLAFPRGAGFYAPAPQPGLVYVTDRRGNVLGVRDVPKGKTR